MVHNYKQKCWEPALALKKLELPRCYLVLIKGKSLRRNIDHIRKTKCAYSNLDKIDSNGDPVLDSRRLLGDRRLSLGLQDSGSLSQESGLRPRREIRPPDRLNL